MMEDQICTMLSHQDWDNPTTDRTENRWNPNGNRTDIDNDTYHDNPWAPPPGGHRP